MHLIYFDESGNSGTNLSDSQQPVFVLADLSVPEEVWPRLEAKLTRAIEQYFPAPRPHDFEIHASDLRSGRKYFREFSLAHRLDFRNACLDLAVHHELRLVYRAIEKKRFARWIEENLGGGVKLNPHIAAFPLVARVIDEHLQSIGESTRGIFISDEQREIVADVEKAIFLLRGVESALRLDRIVEKGFFIDSRKSLVLQLCDLCAYNARKAEERRLGYKASVHDDGGIERIELLTHRGDERWQDTLKWVIAQQQEKERPGDDVPGR